jgi:hypothetical protein
MDYETFLSHDEQHARRAERRYKASEINFSFPPVPTAEQAAEHERKRIEMAGPYYTSLSDLCDQADVGLNQAMWEDAGVTRAEGEVFQTFIQRKPVQVERIQMSLFPEEVA